MEQEGFNLSGIRTIFEKKEGAMAEQARKSLEHATQAEVQSAIHQALVWIFESPSNENSMLIGGDFADASGKTRDRKIVSLSIPDLLEAYPFLSGLCAKLVPNSRMIQRELGIHSDIQEAIDRSRSSLVRVPRLVGVESVNHGLHLAMVMEELPTGTNNQSLQRFVEGIRRQRIGAFPMLEANLAEKISIAFANLHKLGFIHGDINDGNVYLTNMRISQYTRERPRDWSGPFVRDLRLVTSADVVLLDFERATKGSGGEVDKRLAAAEDDLVRNMLRPILFEDISGLSLEEVQEEMFNYSKALKEIDRANLKAAKQERAIPN
jgi:serine/threonine protein kinase